MRKIDKVLISIILGAVFPILGFLAGWWVTVVFLPDRLTFLMALVGLLIGIVADIAYLGKWVSHAYSISLKIWMAVYLFYSIGMFGLFMGVPVFNVLLSIPAGLLIGSKLARQKAERDEIRRMRRDTCIFTTVVLAVVCALSATIALVDPYTSLNLQGMLGLPFEVTQGMLVGIIIIGGLILLALQWVITDKVINLTYALQTNGSVLPLAGS